MRLKTIIAAAAAVTMMWSCGQKAPVPMFVGTYTDKGSSGIYSFMFDQETGKFDLEDSARIGNPSYLVLAPDDSFLYCVSEYTGDDATVNAFMINPKNGQMRIMNKVLAHGDDPCSITTHGRKAFTANYSSGSISVFDIERDGTLEKVGYQNTGKHPRNFAITPNGKYLLVACRDDNRIEVYERNAETGLLTSTARAMQVSQPACIQFANPLI